MEVGSGGDWVVDGDAWQLGRGAALDRAAAESMVANRHGGGLWESGIESMVAMAVGSANWSCRWNSGH